MRDYLIINGYSVPFLWEPIELISPFFNMCFEITRANLVELYNNIYKNRMSILSEERLMTFEVGIYNNTQYFTGYLYEKKVASCTEGNIIIMEVEIKDEIYKK